MKKLNNIIDWKTIKFLIVGVLNTFIGLLIMFSFYNLLHMSYWFSSASNYIIGSILSYIFNKYWTFHNKEKSNKTIIRFIVNIVICYFLAYGIAKPLARYLFRNTTRNIQENIAMITGTILFTVCNYFGQRYFAFKEVDSD